jgi:hypothetical protein
MCRLRRPALTTRVWRCGKSIDSVGVSSGVTRARRGERCVYSAPTMILTWALKLAGKVIGVGKYDRITAAYLILRSNPIAVHC